MSERDAWGDPRRAGTPATGGPPEPHDHEDHALFASASVAGVSPKRVKKAAKATTKAPTRKGKGGGTTVLRIGGHAVKPGSKENILLKISEHYTHQGVYIPVTVVRGKKAGPKLFLTAAIHGDEVNGVQIIREVLDVVEPANLVGTLVAVPVVNRFGFVSHSRYMPDRRDLNRAFPGDPKGSTTARVAHIIFTEIARRCDYGIDLHTAGYQRTNLPQIRGEMENPEVRRLAKAFGAEIILDNRGVKGTLRRSATEAGIPSIIYEAGETFRFERPMITKGVAGILNVMKELGMRQGALEKPPYQVIVKTSAWIRADHGGILETLVEAGSLAYKGAPIARISNPFGRTVDEVKSPFDGLIVGVNTLPMVNPGAPICHIVKLKKTLHKVEPHHPGPLSVPLPRAMLDKIEPDDLPADFEEEDVEG